MNRRVVALGIPTQVCKYAQQCTGCGTIGLPYNEQLQSKANYFWDLLKNQGIEWPREIPIVSAGEFQLRDRVDLVIDGRSSENPELKDQNQDDLTLKTQSKVGIYDRKRHVVDIEECNQMSSPLQSWFQEFRSDLPNIRLGSVRLRVSPDSRKGVWCDFANKDVKFLLEERSWFERLLEKSVVEVGQRRKRLRRIGDLLKLQDPQNENWFLTFDSESNPRPLYTTIGGFTQPGFETNRILIRELVAILKKTQASKWLEMCAGSGNLTVPLATLKTFVYATEFDSQALEALEKTVHENSLTQKIHISSVNLYRPSPQAQRVLNEVEGILVDPPRSGLGVFLDQLETLARKPRDFVYVSCFPETLALDLKRLIDLGYEIREIRGVDQFPQTKHCEFIVSLALGV